MRHTTHCHSMDTLLVLAYVRKTGYSINILDTVIRCRLSISIFTSAKTSVKVPPLSMLNDRSR